MEFVELDNAVSAQSKCLAESSKMELTEAYNLPDIVKLYLFFIYSWYRNYFSRLNYSHTLQNIISNKLHWFS